MHHGEAGELLGFYSLNILTNINPIWTKKRVCKLKFCSLFPNNLNQLCRRSQQNSKNLHFLLKGDSWSLDTIIKLLIIKNKEEKTLKI